MKIPPCLKRALKANPDMEPQALLEDILALHHTFGEEGLEPVLWSIGYFTLDNYESKKNTAVGMMKTASPAFCFDEPPENLKEFCEENCPLKSPEIWLDNAIKQVYILPGTIPTSAVLVVEFKGGEIFKSEERMYLPFDATPFFESAAYEFLEWFKANFGKELPLSAPEIARLLVRRVWG